jgi:hypothetical protein
MALELGSAVPATIGASPRAMTVRPAAARPARPRRAPRGYS